MNDSSTRLRTAVALTAVAITAALATAVLFALPRAHADAGHDPGLPGPGGTLDIPTLTATAKGKGDPFRMEQSAAGYPFCYVGSEMVPCAAGVGTNPEPEQYISAIVKYGAQTSIDPRLILTMLWNEDGHWHALGGDAANGLYDWVRGRTDGPSYGMADMKQAPFDEVKAAHPTLFGDRKWTDLQTDPDLAVQTLAWKLYDISGPVGSDILPRHWNAAFTRDEMLAMAWNQGAGNAVAYSDGKATGDVKKNLDSYKSGVDQYWDRADQIICRSGAFTCSR